MQRFKGLNAWDQLAVEIEVNGNLPSVSPSSSITFSDTTDAYAFQGENKIQSDGSGTITIDDQNFTFNINQAVFTMVIIFHKYHDKILWFFSLD